MPAQDMSDSMFEESEVAKTVREIRARDPAFDMVAFLRSLRTDVQPVIQARTLTCRCPPGMPAGDVLLPCLSP